VREKERNCLSLSFSLARSRFVVVARVHSCARTLGCWEVRTDTQDTWVKVADWGRMRISERVREREVVVLKSTLAPRAVPLPRAPLTPRKTRSKRKIES